MNIKTWIAAWGAVCVVAGASAQKVEWKVSTPDNYWKNEKGAKWTDAPAQGTAVVEITADKAQYIDGMGGTFNELGWDALCTLPEEKRQEVIYNLFSPEESNYTYCRMPIAASDFAMNFYSYNDVVDDFEMVNFSIARDRHILMRYIKEAQKIHPGLKMWASPWAPPAWMKTNNHYASEYDNDAVNHNGLPRHRALELPTTGFKMQPGYLNAYALYFAKFVQAYEKEGIKIEAVHIQNEPCSTQKYASCTWRPEDMAYFIGRFLGPKFEKENIDTEIFFGTINRDNPQYTRVALDDPEAAKYIRGVGFQWDGKGAIPHIHKEYPHLKMMHTEAECGTGTNDWAAAEHTWWQISHYLRNGARAFTYWNMVLDQTGVSPWGWKQNSLITVNTETGEVTYNPEFYLMKHLSHYLVPGAYRLQIPDGEENVLAFENPDGKITILIANRDHEERNLSLAIKGKYLQVKIQPKSFNTLNL